MRKWTKWWTTTRTRTEVIPWSLADGRRQKLRPDKKVILTCRTNLIIKIFSWNRRNNKYSDDFVVNFVALTQFKRDLFDRPELFRPAIKKLNMQMKSFSRTKMKWFLVRRDSHFNGSLRRQQKKATVVLSFLFPPKIINLTSELISAQNNGCRFEEMSHYSWAWLPTHAEPKYTLS